MQKYEYSRDITVCSAKVTEKNFYQGPHTDAPEYNPIHLRKLFLRPRHLRLMLTGKLPRD